MSGPALKLVPAAVVAVCLSSATHAAVIGRPVALDIAVYQGGTELFNESVSIAPVDPLHGGFRYKIVDDYDAFPFGTVASVWLSVEMPDPDEEQSTIHFYLRGANPSNPDLPGSNPLFTLDDTDKITATISNLQFEDGGNPTSVSVCHYDSDVMAGAYMMNFDTTNSYYYDLPEAEEFMVGSQHTQQVPHSAFVDGDVDNFVFVPDSGTSLDIGWYLMPSPTLDPNGDFPFTYTHDVAGASPGKVFEMGLAASVSIIPEPATVGVCLLGGLACFRRRRS